MLIVKRSNIKIPPNRQRSLLDIAKVQELATSIESKGLLHPPVVRKGENEDEYFLVCGERRLTAIDSIHLLGNSFSCDGWVVPADTVPITLLSDLSPLEIEEAELEENICRVDLSLQDHSVAVTRLHELRAKQNPAQTATATATEILGLPASGSQVHRLTEQMLIARNLDNPAVAKAKTHKEAIKAISVEAEKVHRAKLALVFDQSKSKNNLTHGDALELLKLELPSSYDLILTDPPYGINADSFGDMSGTGHNYADTEDYAFECYNQLFKSAKSIMKPDGALFAFCDIRNFERIKALALNNMLYVWSKPMIWAKTNGMLSKPDFGPRFCYEAIIFITHSATSHKVKQVGQSDVLFHSSVSSPRHGAEKPVSLYADIIARSCFPGAKILDPFAGSGTIFPAANSANCQANAFEFDETNYNLALSRINDKGDTNEPATNLEAILGN